MLRMTSRQERATINAKNRFIFRRSHMEDKQKTILFEETPIPKAVLAMSVPTIISSLVMVIYNLADTYFVGMVNDPVQNAAVALAAPVLLAFNAVNNLFGVGSSSMMSRALGSRDYDTVYRSSAFGFYCALLSGAVFSILFTAFRHPLCWCLVPMPGLPPPQANI